jgi:pimeloyl-ACP methyl ester carboxylesterase
LPRYLHDGIDLHYEIIGVGPPVLCVHGATGTGSHEWSTVAGALSDRFRFIVPDLRGHGSSAHRAGEMSIEAVNGDLLELISREHLEPPHLLAFSFGSEVALELELTCPGTAASLILLSPGLGDPKSSLPTRRQLESSWPRTLRELHTQRHGEEHWLEVMLELCHRAAARPRTDLGAYGEIGCPVLLIVGSNDDPRRIRQAELMEQAHRSTELIVIPDARHRVHQDQSSAVISALGAFLDRVTEEVPGPLPGK